MYQFIEFTHINGTGSVSRVFHIQTELRRAYEYYLFELIKNHRDFNITFFNEGESRQYHKVVTLNYLRYVNHLQKWVHLPNLYEPVLKRVLKDLGLYKYMAMPRG